METKPLEIHFADALTRQTTSLCGRLTGGQLWILASRSPLRTYVGPTKFSINVAAVHTLQKGGVPLEPCPECLRRI